MKWFTETKKRRSTGPQPATKSGRRPAGSVRALFCDWAQKAQPGNKNGHKEMCLKARCASGQTLTTCSKSDVQEHARCADAQVRRRAERAGTRSTQARGARRRAERASARTTQACGRAETRGACKRAEHASTRARGRALQPAVRSGLSLLVRARPEVRGSAPRWRRARRRSPEAQGVPRAPKDSRQALEAQPGRNES